MLWPDSKGESIALKGHMGAVRSVDFSVDSRHLLTSSDDKTAKVTTNQNSFLLSLRVHIHVNKYMNYSLHSIHYCIFDYVVYSLIYFHSFWLYCVSCGVCPLVSLCVRWWVTATGCDTPRSRLMPLWPAHVAMTNW